MVCGIVPKQSEWDICVWASMDFVREQDKPKFTLREILAVGAARCRRRQPHTACPELVEESDRSPLSGACFVRPLETDRTRA